MEDAITFTEYNWQTKVFTEIQIDRGDIVAVKKDEHDPEEYLKVFLDSGKEYTYTLSEENDEEEQEWLLGFCADRDYTSRSY